jgi:hypothetical protein
LEGSGGQKENKMGRGKGNEQVEIQSLIRNLNLVFWFQNSNGDEK